VPIWNGKKENPGNKSLKPLKIGSLGEEELANYGKKTKELEKAPLASNLNWILPQ